MDFQRCWSAISAVRIATYLIVLNKWDSNVKLKHKNYAICVLWPVSSCFRQLYWWCCSDRAAGGFHWVQADVPQSGLRLKLKGLIGKCPSMIYVSSFQIYNKDQSVVCLVCSLRLNPRGMWHLVSFPDCISCTCSKLGLVNCLFHSPSSAPEWLTHCSFLTRRYWKLHSTKHVIGILVKWTLIEHPSCCIWTRLFYRLKGAWIGSFKVCCLLQQNVFT